MKAKNELGTNLRNFLCIILSLILIKHKTRLAMKYYGQIKDINNLYQYYTSQNWLL